MKNIIFPADTAEGVRGWGLLVLRVSVGLLIMFGHGWSKITNYATYQEQFPDPLGFGGEMSLGLAIFAEFFCGLAVVLGLFTRVAVIPLIVTMLTAVLIVHSDDPFAQKELALMYLIPFVTLLITGPGKYSFDSIVSRKFDNPTAKI